MEWISWFFIILLGFAVGYFLVNYLTVHPSRMKLYLAVTLLCIFILLALIAVRFEMYAPSIPGAGCFGRIRSRVFLANEKGFIPAG